MLERLPPFRRAPIAVAGFLAVPLFFASLMAATLAVEKPRAVEWTRAGRLIARYHPPTASTEVRIWLLALVPPLLVVLVGLVSTFVRGGTYVVAAAAIVLSIGLPHRLDRWTAHHTARYPFGVDLVPDSAPDNLLQRGQWEHEARSTVLSLSHWTIGLACTIVLVLAVLELRRRRAAAAVETREQALLGDSPG